MIEINHEILSDYLGFKSDGVYCDLDCIKIGGLDVNGTARFAKYSKRVFNYRSLGRRVTGE